MTVVGTRRASPYGTEVAYALGQGPGRGRRAGDQRAGARESTARLTEAAWTAAACPSRWWRAGRTWSIRAATGPSTSACGRPGWCCRSCPPGTEPYRWSFPARNRIMAGLARDDAGGRGRRPERQPDHGGVRQGPRAVRGGGAGTDHVQRRPRHQQPAEGRRHADQRHRGRPGRAVRRRACGGCPEARPAPPGRSDPDPPGRPGRRRERATRSRRWRPPSACRSPGPAPRWAASRSTATSSGATWAAGSGRPDDRPAAPARRSRRGAGCPASRGAWVRGGRAELPDSVWGARHRRQGCAGARVLRGEDAHRPARDARTCSGRSPRSGCASSGRCGRWHASGSPRARLEGARPPELRFDAIGVSFDAARPAAVPRASRGRVLSGQAQLAEGQLGVGDRLERHPVQRRDAVGGYRGAVLGGRVAHVRLEVPAGVALGGAAHVAVAAHLREHRGRRYRGAAAVAVHDGALLEAELRHVEAVHQAHGARARPRRAGRSGAPPGSSCGGRAGRSRARSATRSPTAPPPASPAGTAPRASRRCAASSRSGA